jgi:xanthine dehydrogenase molybdopterin-binding subunit B
MLTLIIDKSLYDNMCEIFTNKCINALQVTCYAQTIGGILAINREVAKQAAGMVKVKYEPLPTVVTIKVGVGLRGCVHNLS